MSVDAGHGNQVEKMVRVRAVAINGAPRAFFPRVTFVLACGAWVAAMGAFRPAASQDTPALARAEAFLAGLSAYQAHVTQRYHDRLHDRTLDAEGSIALSRPDHLTVRFEDGRGLSLAGTAALAYDPDVGEHGMVQERTLGDDDFPELRALLAGTATLADTFDVRAIGPSASGEVLEVRPRARTIWDRALVSFGEDGPTRLLVVDPAGNTVRWVLSRAVRRLPVGALALPVPDRATHIAP